MSTNLDLSTRPVSRYLGLIAGALVIAHVAALFLQAAGVDGRYTDSLFRRFDLDQEYNVPAFFNSVLLLICGLLLAVAGQIAAAEQPEWTKHWRWLALIFGYLAIDEATELHGFFSELNRLIDTGIFRFAWVLVYGPLVAVLGLVYLRFLFRLPRRTAIGFVVAATVYVGGALGMEIVGGAWSVKVGEDNTVYHVIVTIEESLELAGLILFINTLLAHTQLRVSRGWMPTTTGRTLAESEAILPPGDAGGRLNVAGSPRSAPVPLEPAAGAHNGMNGAATHEVNTAVAPSRQPFPR